MDSEYWKEKILTKMSIYYNSEKLAKEWYNRPNKYMKAYRLNEPTPSQAVDDNRGEEVWNWIITCIGE